MGDRTTLAPTLPLRTFYCTAQRRREFIQSGPDDGVQTECTPTRAIVAAAVLRPSRGQRWIDKTPHGHGKTTTLIAALGITVVGGSTVVHGVVNGDTFEAVRPRSGPSG